MIDRLYNEIQANITISDSRNRAATGLRLQKSIPIGMMYVRWLSERCVQTIIDFLIQLS